MNQNTDQSGLFADFNFKLIVIDALLDKSPGFLTELQALANTHCDSYEWYTGSGPIQEIVEFFSKLVISDEDLAKITELCFDGGNEVYFYLKPDWDGEDELFDVQSVAGFEHLPNLRSVVYISMVDEQTLKPMVDFGIQME